MFRLKKHRNSICILRLHLSPSVCLCLGFKDMVDTRVLTFWIILSCQTKHYYFHYNLQGTFWGNIETRTRYLQKRIFELNSLAAKEWIANYNMSTSLTSKCVQQIMFLLRVSWDSARRFYVSIGGRHFKFFRIITIVTLTCGHPKALIIEKTLGAQHNLRRLHANAHFFVELIGNVNFTYCLQIWSKDVNLQGYLRELCFSKWLPRNGPRHDANVVML